MSIVRKGWIPLGRIGGVALLMHPLFVFLLIAVFAQGVLIGGGDRAARTALVILPLFASLLLHELGHAITARRLGIPVHSVVLGPLINYASLTREPDDPRDEFRIAAAGPLVNAAIWIVATIGYELATLLSAPGTASVFHTIALINLAMCLFNLVPAFPLDGGRLLRSTFGKRMPYLVATRAALKVASGFLFLPALILLHPLVYQSPMAIAILLAIVVFLIRTGRREARAAMIRELTLQWRAGTELPSDLTPIIARAATDTPLTGWRALPPGQFRQWRNRCEDALRSEIGARSSALEDDEGPRQP